MKISIITVCYNSQDTIRETIESVIHQSYDDIEYIVVDGKSNDNSLNIIKSYNNNIDIFISENDDGIYDAINKGIKKASGDIIGLLHADDVFDNNYVIENVISSFNNNDILYGDINYVKKNNVDKIVRRWISSSYTPNKFKWGWMPPHTGFFMKRESYIKFGLYRLDVGTSADYELMLRMFKVYKLTSIYCPINIVRMRVGGVSNSTIKNRWLANKNDKKSWKLNSLKAGWFTFLLKPLLKIKQFI